MQLLLLLLCCCTYMFVVVILYKTTVLAVMLLYVESTYMYPSQLCHSGKKNWLVNKSPNPPNMDSWIQVNFSAQYQEFVL